jgi:hypothetical protein
LHFFSIIMVLCIGFLWLEPMQGLHTLHGLSLFAGGRMATAAELLAALDLAILDILQNGADVSFNGRRYVKADLGVLQKMRAEYAAIVATSTSGGVFDRMKVGAPYRA